MQREGVGPRPTRSGIGKRTRTTEEETTIKRIIRGISGGGGFRGNQGK